MPKGGVVDGVAHFYCKHLRCHRQKCLRCHTEETSLGQPPRILYCVRVHKCVCLCTLANTDAICIPLPTGFALAWSPCTTGQLARSGDDGIGDIWDVGVTRLVSSLRTDVESVVSDLAFSHVPNVLGVVAGRGVEIWDLRNGGRIRQLFGHDGDANALAFTSFRPVVLASGGSDNAVLLWDLRLERHIHPLMLHSKPGMLLCCVLQVGTPTALVALLLAYRECLGRHQCGEHQEGASGTKEKSRGNIQ